MTAPAALVARGPDGTEQVLVRAGGGLPAAARIVLATSRAGQDALEVDLLEGEGEAARLVARARFTLPRGLPANAWIPVEVSVGPDLRVRAEARENLRRVRAPAAFTPGAGDTAYQAG
ncbi:MAG: hypothetical protein KF878_28530 [Planctomycetes bacterium]|nr:hypothetical protein [Planctomycetota bacterium]